MDQIAAFAEVIRIAEENRVAFDTANLGSDACRTDHLIDMFARVLVARELGKEFDEAKLGRWLGWAQCSLVAAGVVSLEEMKELNRRHQ